MKTAKHLFQRITSFETVLSAARLAAKGKGAKQPNLRFFMYLEDNVWKIVSELKDKSYRPGPYTIFAICYPKPRMISAAPFYDRVVHHALISVVGPLLEKTFVFDTYANRKGKGTHLAIERYQHYLRRYRYALKCDIRKFFPSIDHAILKSLLRRKIGCADTLWLIDTIIDNSNRQEEHVHYFPGDDLFAPFERRRGLPIGNLTSQFFANYYLGFLDHFVKESLRCKGYVRYVDDFVLFADTKQQLWAWHEEIERYLEQFRLILNPVRTALYPTSEDRCFLGQRVFPACRMLPSKNVRAAKRRVKAGATLGAEDFRQSVSGWVGHARQADTFRLLQSMGLTDLQGSFSRIGQEWAFFPVS
jgi:retron-type reverse transcriptase